MEAAHPGDSEACPYCGRPEGEHVEWDVADAQTEAATGIPEGTRYQVGHLPCVESILATVSLQAAMEEAEVDWSELSRHNRKSTP